MTKAKLFLAFLLGGTTYAVGLYFALQHYLPEVCK